MSRTATATPPPPYFPQRNATPTMRHAAAPNVNAAHFSTRHQQHGSGRRKTKNLPSSIVGALSSTPKKKPQELPSEDSLSLSFEEVSTQDLSHHRRDSMASTRQSPISFVAAASTESFVTDVSGQDDEDHEMGRSIPTPSMSTSCSASFMSTPLPTPGSSRAPSLLQPETSIVDPLSSISSLPESQAIPPQQVTPPPRASWVPNLGKMAKAVVNTGMSMGISFTEKRSKKDSVTPAPGIARPGAQPVFVPAGSTPRPTVEELALLSDDAAMQRRREWAADQHKWVTECARLCSQWPHSGYNQSKWGPNGAKTYYEPQSYANPHYVATLMQRQAELERQLSETSATFFSCQRDRRAPSEDSISDPSLESYDSSPAGSMSLSAEFSADISAAMASPLISFANGPNDSQASLLLPTSPKSIKGARSLTELDVLASSMTIESSSAMDMDQESTVPDIVKMPINHTRPIRAQSCGSKRPLPGVNDEEEKRRRVDEAMVVDEAVETGVIMPSNHVMGQKQLSASTPNLSSDQPSHPNSPAVFGHVVKTSDTHPIIISPFFPVDLVPTISEHVIVPHANVYSADCGPFMLGSKIDVPSLLLSFNPPQARISPALVPSPILSSFQHQQPTRASSGVHVGNLLLSSCPGKRLRMGGPVKGRGPVCRDLATDLRRIKSEGVGCLVCCLDDPELALLGVPWETYRQVAAETGLDVIRLPMPDGFTPVSLAMFDSQVALIATQYSLQGINVLVHCRGGVGRAGLTASAWAIKMGFVAPHPSLAIVEEAAIRQARQVNRHNAKHSNATIPVELPAELEHQIVMSIVERVIAMIRSRRGLKAIESFEQVQFLASYVRWLRAGMRG